LALILSASEDGGRAVAIESQSGEEWTLHAAMVLRVGPGLPPERMDVGAVTGRCGERVACGEAFYGTLGNAYGGDFRSLVAVWHGAAESIGEVDLTVAAATDRPVVPAFLAACAWLDCCTHAALAQLDLSRVFFCCKIV